MEKVNFSININAPKEKVWNTLWEDSNYRKWTSVFSEDSHVVTDWQEGSKVLFLNGKGEGMVSTIETNKPNEFMSFRHVGTVKNGVEDTDSEETKQWSGAHENYTLTEAGGVTELSVEVDVEKEFKDYFTQTMPKALDLVKELSEQDD
ncbi:MAG TPA: SRPBCC domain-containing protein [Hanamia sp.]|nr:SRPBCC domain-containing protein [Hanamia sp.]